MPATQLHCHAPVLARARGFLGQTPIKCSPLLSFSRGSLASGPHAQPSPAGNCSVSSNNFCLCSRMRQAIVSVLWNDKQQITARERFALSLNCTFMKFLFDNLHDYMGTYLHREYWSIGPWYRCACTHINICTHTRISWDLATHIFIIAAFVLTAVWRYLPPYVGEQRKIFSKSRKLLYIFRHLHLIDDNLINLKKTHPCYANFAQYETTPLASIRNPSSFNSFSICITVLEYGYL